jgi:hypothetical protein
MRVRRGTLRSEKGEDGRVYVFVSDQDVTRTEAMPPDPQREVEASRELVDALRAQVEDLRTRLDRETEANRENRRIIAGLIERVPELEPPAEASPAPRGGPEGAAEEEQAPTPTEPRPDPQEASERPWWRRLLGG